MEARRFRRFILPRQTLQPQPIIPTTTHSNSHSSISYCYLDYKFSTFNNPIFNLGLKHSHFLKPWFSIGVSFSLYLLLSLSLLLPLSLLLHLPTFLLSLFSSPLNDAAYVLAATLFSVSLHELGHALAAARAVRGYVWSTWLFLLPVAFPGHWWLSTRMSCRSCHAFLRFVFIVLAFGTMLL